MRGRMRNQSFIGSFALIVMVAALLLALPQASHAAAVTAVLCAVQAYPCPVGQVLDSGIRADGVGVLPGNTYTLLNFAFADAAVTFTGPIDGKLVGDQSLTIVGSRA